MTNPKEMNDGRSMEEMMASMLTMVEGMSERMTKDKKEREEKDKVYERENEERKRENTSLVNEIKKMREELNNIRSEQFNIRKNMMTEETQKESVNEKEDRELPEEKACKLLEKLKENNEKREEVDNKISDLLKKGVTKELPNFESVYERVYLLTSNSYNIFPDPDKEDPEKIEKLYHVFNRLYVASEKTSRKEAKEYFNKLMRHYEELCDKEDMKKLSVYGEHYEAEMLAKEGAAEMMNEINENTQTEDVMDVDVIDIENEKDNEDQTGGKEVERNTNRPNDLI
eukprot:Awhi_evm1s3140